MKTITLIRKINIGAVMKRRHPKIFLWGVVSFLSVTPVFPAESVAGDEISKQLATLSEILELTPQQADKVKEILQMELSQAERDREHYMGNGVALYQVALQRRRITDSHIEDLLKGDQSDRYTEYQKKRSGEDEFLMWSEGLQLTEKQKEEVKYILEEYIRRPGSGPGEMRSGMAPRSGKGPGGMRGGRPGGMGGMPGMGGRRGGGEEMVERVMEMVKKREKEKAKEIKKILTDVQKEMWKPLLDFHLSLVEKKEKEQVKKMKDRRGVR